MNGILLVDKAQDWTSNDVVAKLKGVEEVTISYMAQKMLVTYADGADEQAVLAEILAAARKIEPDFMLEA